MKIEIRKEILLQMNNKLTCNKLFPTYTLTNKDGVLTSVDTNEKAKVTRWFTLPLHTYKILDKGEDFTIKIHNKKLKDIISLTKAKSYSTLEFPVTKKFNDKTKHFIVVNIEEIKHEESNILWTQQGLGDIHFNIEKSDNSEPMPYKPINNLPQITTKYGKETLDSYIVMSKRDVKNIIAQNKIFGKGRLIRFTMPRLTRRLKILFGDIAEDGIMLTMEPRVQTYNINEDVELTFDTTLEKVLHTFDNDIKMYMRSNFPMIIQEIDSDFGVMIEPHTEFSNKPTFITD